MSFFFKILLIFLMFLGLIRSNNNLFANTFKDTTELSDSPKVIADSLIDNNDSSITAIQEQEMKITFDLKALWQQNKVAIITSAIGGLLLLWFLGLWKRIGKFLVSVLNRIQKKIKKHNVRKKQKRSFSLKKLEEHDFAIKIFYSLQEDSRKWKNTDSIAVGTQLIKQKALKYLEKNYLVKIKNQKVKLTRFGKKVAYEKNKHI